MDAQQFHVAIALGIAAVGAGFDIRSKTIPNTLTFGGLLVGLAVNTMSGFHLGGIGGAARGFGVSLLGVFLTAFLPLVLFTRGEMGGGDVKILGAIGALCGPVLGFRALGATYLFIALVMLPMRFLLKKKLTVVGANVGVVFGNLFRAREARVKLTPIDMPPMIMAPSIFMGLALSTLPHWNQL